MGNLGLIPGLGRSPGEGKGYPLQYDSWDYLKKGNSWDVYLWLVVLFVLSPTEQQMLVHFSLLRPSPNASLMPTAATRRAPAVPHQQSRAGSPHWQLCSRSRFLGKHQASHWADGWRWLSEPKLLILSSDHMKVAQSCLTLCDRMDCSPLGSTVHGISQARILEAGGLHFTRSACRTPAESGQGLRKRIYRSMQNSAGQRNWGGGEEQEC